MLAALVGAVGTLVAVYAEIFVVLMKREEADQTWVTGAYWTLQTMSTLGYGDVTFRSDLGRTFSMVVLVLGLVVLLIFLPFTLIQLIYAPWLDRRRAAARRTSCRAKRRGMSFFPRT